MRRTRKDGVRHDFRQNRKRVDAGIENTEAAGLPDPGLAGMPLTHVFLPRHADAARIAFFQQPRGWRHAVGVLGMPSLIERAADLFCKMRQVRELQRRCAGRLFEQHMLAFLQRELGGGIVLLWWRADRHGIEIGETFEHRFDGAKIGDVARFAVAARRRDEGEIAIGKDGRDMLVARDFSDTHDANAGRLHERSSGLAFLCGIGFIDREHASVARVRSRVDCATAM